MSSSQLSYYPPEESPKLSRFCYATGRAFAPGETVYSTVCEEDGEIVRRDYCADAWRSTNRAENAIAWWTTTVSSSGKEPNAQGTPNDALVKLFDFLADKPDQADLRYALALLLVRRRALRFEFDEPARDAVGEERRDTIYVYSPRDDSGCVVPVVRMDSKQIADVQARLVALLNSPTFSLPDEHEVESAAEAAAREFDASDAQRFCP